MGQVLIRDLDDAVIADYREAAESKGHSLEAELRDALGAARPKKRLSRDELAELSRRLRAMTPPEAAAMDSTEIIRADRDTR